MKFFAPKKETSKIETFELSDINYEKQFDEPNDSSVPDSDWVQMNDADNFNNFTEEY